MFDEIRYELDGVEIDRNRNVGITSTLKNYVTISSDKSVIMRNAGWDAHTDAHKYFFFAYRCTCYWDFAKITDAW